ncbi:MAG: Type restriction enzyme protein [Verrucomicrobiota bacterium]|jgi:hypothetical protein
MKLLNLTPTVKNVKDLKDEAAEMTFVKIFRKLMHLRNIVESFADYRSAYLDL